MLVQVFGVSFEAVPFWQRLDCGHKVSVQAPPDVLDLLILVGNPSLLQKGHLFGDVLSEAQGFFSVPMESQVVGFVQGFQSIDLETVLQLVLPHNNAL